MSDVDAFRNRTLGRRGLAGRRHGIAVPATLNELLHRCANAPKRRDPRQDRPAAAEARYGTDVVRGIVVDISVERVAIDVLGPMRVRVGSAEPALEVSIGPFKERALLAILALSKGRELSADVLIDALWPAAAPPSARKLLQVYVSHLRRAIGDALETRPTGYALRVDCVTVDAETFARLVVEGCRAQRSGDAALASALLHESLDLWRGVALADVAYESFARPAAERLEELRLTAIEECAAADLALGRQVAVVGELRSAVVASPLRERMRGQLMHALYRCGRQAEALAVYEDGRRLLLDELGLSPGPELQRVHRALLEQDPALDAEHDGVAGSNGRAVPIPATSLIGRDQERRELTELLVDTQARLVTITGPGGIGKTRLAIAVASDVGAHVDGTVFVDLSAVTDAAMVMRTIADAFERTRQVPHTPGAPLADLIARAVGADRVLLLLDNMEQVLGAAADVAALLAAAPTLTVLITSRARLRISGERVYAAPPLPLPTADELDLTALAQVPSVALFTERARAVIKDFALGPGNAAAITGICLRLEGVPLAIELAAPRVSLLSPDALLERLAQRLPLLSDGSWDLPARQRTVRATIDWSYALLGAVAQRVLQRLALFPGGWTLAAAEHVSGRSEALVNLSSLLENSLIRREGDGPAPRYSMLETVREFALEKLHAGAEAAFERDRVRDYFADLAATAEPMLTGADQARWLELLEAEHDNFRAVLQWCRDTQEAARELEIATSLGRFWYVRGHIGEGRIALEEALGRSTHTACAATRAKGFRMASAVAVIQGDYAAARHLAEQALALYRGEGDTLGVVRSLSNLGAILLGEGALEASIVVLDECVALARSVPDQRLRALALNNRGDVALTSGQYDIAVPLFRESLELLRAAGDLANVARSLFNLGAAMLESGDVAGASPLLLESLTLSRSVGDKEDVIWCLLGLAAVAATKAEHRRATVLLSGASSLLRDMGATLKPFERGLHDRTLALLRSAGLEEEFEAAWVEGSTASLGFLIENASAMGASRD